MISVLLVDDEPLILEGLQALIDWDSLGCEIVGTACSGEEALLKYSETACDLVITDIRMSNMNGLQLIREWQQIQPKTKWIVLSGYQDFNYVKQGLVLGIENYLVKPVNELELITTVEQIKKKIESSNQNQISTYILRDNAVWLYLHEEITEDDFTERMEISDIEVSSKFEQLVLLTFPFSQLETQYPQLQQKLEAIFEECGVICSITPKNDFLLLFQRGAINPIEIKGKVSGFVEKQVALPFLLFIGNQCNEKSEIKRSLSLAQQFQERYAFFNKTRVVVENEGVDLKSSQQPIQLEPLLMAVKDGNVEEANSWLTEHLMCESYSPKHIKNGALDALISIHSLTSAVDTSTFSELVNDIMSSKTISELTIQVETFIENAILHINKNKEVNHSLIHDVLDYLQKGYKEEISLKLLGQRFFINSIYLGQLFQKEVGVSFSEYLNQIRLEKAKELLLTTREKAGKIGKEVGYSDPTYFYKQFKKQCGVTPNEFRTLAKVKSIVSQN